MKWFRKILNKITRKNRTENIEVPTDVVIEEDEYKKEHKTDWTEREIEKMSKLLLADTEKE